MEVDAQVWYWTPAGMREFVKTSAEGYIAKRDVERLLEDAHRRGYIQGDATGNQFPRGEGG